MLTIAVRQTIALPESPSGFSGHQWHRRRRPPTSCSCQLHKLRNVTDRLPDALASTVANRMRRAYHQLDALVAQADLEALARELGRSYPGAAASLREGLAETLTIGRLGVPPTLARTLRSTNSIESMIEICRDHAANVKRWQDGQMVLRWIAAGMSEAPSSSAASTGTYTCFADRTRPDNRHRYHTDQGGCRRLIIRRAATDLPRNTGHPLSSLTDLSAGQWQWAPG